MSSIPRGKGAETGDVIQEPPPLPPIPPCFGANRQNNVDTYDFIGIYYTYIYIYEGANYGANPNSRNRPKYDILENGSPFSVLRSPLSSGD
jgi:hypothetical protein